MFTYWRVHSGDEKPETVLDPRRPDGWVADDEEYKTQPEGVSVCDDLDGLRRYIREYSMAVQPGDVVLELRGRRVGHDRDNGATRIRVAEIVAVHPLAVLEAE